MQFILKEELTSFHLRGQLLQMKIRKDTLIFPSTFKTLILMTSSIKYDDIITKIKMSCIYFYPCQMYYKTAKFGGVWRNTSGDNRGR